MATRVCPECGSQYVASVRRCIDCDVVLVDEAVPDGEIDAPSSAEPLGSGDQVGYELEGWGNQLKVTLEGMLDKAGIRRVWEAGALVVPAEFEDQVDQLVATVEGGEAVELDDDLPQIAFEIEALSREEIDDLDARLIAAQVPHAWEDTGALLVAEADEDAVAAMIDEVLAGPDEEEDDGLAVQQALSALYVAVDKLGKDPFDAKLRVRYVAAAADLDGLGVPYGLAGDEWQSLLDQVAALSEDLDAGLDEDDELDDDEVDDDEVDESDEDEDDSDDPDDESEEVEDDADDEDEDRDEPDDVDADPVEESDDDDDADADDDAEVLAGRVRALRSRLVELV